LNNFKIERASYNYKLLTIKDIVKLHDEYYILTFNNNSALNYSI